MRTALAVTVVASLLIPFGDARGQGAAGVAGQIESALKSGHIEQALVLWEENKDGILADNDACLTAARAWLDFGSTEQVMRFAEIPEECVGMAVECLTAADGRIQEDDAVNRLAVARLLLKAGDLFIAVGKGDEGAKHQDRAMEHLKALVALPAPPAGANVDLGVALTRMADREPPKAEEHLAKAAEAFDRERKASGESAYLCLRVGETRQKLAEMREEALSKDPKNRDLAKGMEAAWNDAMKAFESAVKADAKDRAAATAYNECLWELLRITGGKAKQKPILEEQKVRYGRLKIRVPVSSRWEVVKEADFKEDYELFRAYKYNEKHGQGIAILIDHYKWDCTYSNEETGESIGGDNIGGLSRRSERSVREYFTDVKDRTPLHAEPLNKYVRKSEMFSCKGMGKDSTTTEVRVVYFKESSCQRTFEVMVIADLGMLDRNPYELRTILDTLEIVPRK